MTCLFTLDLPKNMLIPIWTERDGVPGAAVEGPDGHLHGCGGARSNRESEDIGRWRGRGGGDAVIIHVQVRRQMPAEEWIATWRASS